MFSGCNNLSNLDVSGFDTGNVTDMRWMFSGCSNLSNLDVSGFDTGNVTDMGEMFFGCNILSNLDVSGFDTGNVKDMWGMFSGCSNLMIIHTPRGVQESVILPVSEDYGPWFAPSGAIITELPIDLSQSILIQRFPIAVKYVPYEASLQGNKQTDNVTYILESGSLPQGIELRQDGVIIGVPLEAGNFSFSVRRTDNSNHTDAVVSYVLTVRENTNADVKAVSDPGYELIEYVPDLDMGSLTAGGSHTLVSRGEFSEFVAVYLNGRKLIEGTDYTAESGSTRITIIDETLTGEGAGTHTIGIEFRTADNTLRRAAQNYTVTGDTNSGNGGDTDNDDNDNNNNNDSGNDDNSNNETGSDNNISDNDSGNNNNDNSNNDHTSSDSSVDPTPDFITYVIQRGDTLWRLAARYYGTGRFWTRIYQDNQAILRNPNLLRVGQVLTIYLDGRAESDREQGFAPVETAGTYTVRSGDSLWKIAASFYRRGSLWRRIYQANLDKITDPGRIHIGQVFTIPGE